MTRALLTVATLAVVALLCLLMLKGWRSRQRRQADLPAPPAPPAARGDALLPPVPGLFVGTVRTGDWLDRVAVHDLSHRGAGWLTVTSDGVHVDRDGLPELHLPHSALRSARTGDALAGKVVGRDGLLLVDWQLGDHLLTSAFRADDHDQHQRLADAVTTQLSQEVSP
jgi:hypothetical protein